MGIQRVDSVKVSDADIMDGQGCRLYDSVNPARGEHYPLCVASTDDR